ncbi:hypothetical protein [Thalassolituus oleivorans]|uniref:hypothetical protein n=1 Tax=Thalassolituus oleivorans TaxID=187493 RepID=UPI0023F50BD8|nr:hypothetical protein [Thalassolituus oleivorans]
MSLEQIDRLKLIWDEERLTATWLADRTGIDEKRWRSVRAKRVEIRGSEIEQISKIFPEYGYWLLTGIELPEAGQISPMTKKAQ